MKPTLFIVRLLVGLLFIFSGLIKANDPLGLSYKMQEFFEVWGLHGLNGYTLILSIIINSFEIVAGVAVILGWKFRLFSWLLLLLIVFFTFLTGYAVLSGKIRECGCFGDCIKLTAKDSFIKDLVLLGLILFLFTFRRKVEPILGRVANVSILLFSAVFAVSLQIYVLRHLPVVDCLPFKVNNNLPEKMKLPPGSIPDSTVINFVYSKNGKEVEFTADKFPADFDDSYQFVRRYDKLIRKGNADIPIKDFSLKTINDNDTTEALLNEPGLKLILFLKDNFHKGRWTNELMPVMQIAAQKNIPGFVVTNVSFEDLQKAEIEVLKGFVPLRADVVAIKTAARTNPTLYLIRHGTVLKKWGEADIEFALKEMQKLESYPIQKN